ncbi:MAG: glycosyltransferase [Ignavibacteriaceae bacterium]
MDLSIIIVNYNVKEFLQNLLHSIAKATLHFSNEIIVVDNASDDGSIELIREKFPNVKLIVNQKNLGFSKANNIGLKVASGNFLLLINPDTIVREDTFQKMLKFFEEYPEAGLAGCKILNPDGTLQLACRRSFPGPWTSFCKVTGLSSIFPKSKIFASYNLTYLDEDQTYEVDALSGSFMMMRREALQMVGGLDEQFFMYGEDLDLCYRIQKAGFKVFYVHSTQIIHYKGESTKRSSIDETKIFYDAMKLFVKKHLSSSFLVELILTSAITFRKFFAFLGKRKLIIISILLDFVFFDLSLFAASKIYSVFGHWHGFPDFIVPVVYTIPALLHILVASVSGVYKKDSLSVLKNYVATVISFFLLSSLTFFVKQYAYSRAAIIITYAILLFSLAFWRSILKIFFRIGITGDGFTSKRTLIVGTNNHAIQIAKKLKMRQSDYHSISGLIGFSYKEIGKKFDEFEVVGSIENIIKVIRDRKINEIIFSTEELSYNQMMSIVSNCRKEPVEFKLIGTNLDFLVGKTSVSILDDMPIFEIKYNISNPALRVFKNIFDYSLASLVLFFIYPFIYLILKAGTERSEFKDFVLNIPSIFSGKVSFVGPKRNNLEKSIYLGKKGLTGLWFIESSQESENDKLDILYAKNQNIWLDLEILSKTLIKMWDKRK